MLAYTPLHHLLLDAVGRPLVMTSGNLSEEPIATGNDEALRTARRHRRRLPAARPRDRRALRRFRACASAGERPDPPAARPRLRAAPARPAGGEPAAAPGGGAAPQEHLHAGARRRGVRQPAHRRPREPRDAGALRAPRWSASARCSASSRRSSVRDLHPGYLSTRVAEELGLAGVIAVQHHHAHIAAVLAEHGVHRPGASGSPSTAPATATTAHVWGAEVLVADLHGVPARRRTCATCRSPAATSRRATPWRAALGYLLARARTRAGVRARVRRRRRRAERERRELQIAARAERAAAPRRWAASSTRPRAVLGVRRDAQYEGQAAMELEALPAGAAGDAAAVPDARRRRPWVLDPVPLLAALGERRAARRGPGRLAARFHESVAAAPASRGAPRRADATGLDTVALGGGVFQNARLLASLHAAAAWIAGSRCCCPGGSAPTTAPSATARPRSRRRGSPQ